MNNFCTFYIVRHAQSKANALHLRGGQTDFDISEAGAIEAQKRAKDLASIHFVAAFSSDLLRAQKTANIIAVEHNLEVHLSKELRERAWGQELEGKTVKETAELLKEWQSLTYQERYRKRPMVGVETDEELMTRLLTFLRTVASVYLGKTVLIVAHSNIMRTLLVHLGWGQLRELPGGSLGNTGYFVLESDGVEFEVVKTVGIEKKVI